jgi:UDP-N-acetylmuramoyl-L-alanyl-D-glutamate--2,6-diaminopimelate ligase
MKLKELADALPAASKPEIIGDASTSIESLAYDSRQIFPGVAFVCLKGERADGHAFIADAVKRGAVALVVNHAQAEKALANGLPFLCVEDTRRALPYIAAAFYGKPSEKLDLIGVTGTNGKTTTTYMIASILQAAGDKTGVIGTVGVQIDGKSVPTQWTVSTTPESLDLQQLFSRMRQEHVRHAVMEVTSHAIDQERTSATSFATAVFTNLTQDHLDYHKTMEAYQAAKERLFLEYPARTGRKDFSAVINIDDPAGAQIARKVEAQGHEVWRYGISSPEARLRATDIHVRPDGTNFTVVENGENQQSYPVSLRIGGLFNVLNALAAIGAARARGIAIHDIQRGLKNLSSVPGRFEPVDTGTRGFHVLVDYAHTPDGLVNVLKSARALEPNRLLVVFGCGGNRDRTKRPKMGRIAQDLADLVVVTSDNPRNEEPNAIIEEILAGIDGGRGNPKVFVEADRGKAIRIALCEQAKPGNIVVIAGKGHETYQIVGDQTLHFDDREVAREALSECV